MTDDTVAAADLTLDKLAAVFATHDVETEWCEADGERLLAAVWDGVYCLVELSDLGDDDVDEWRYVTFTATENVRDGAERAVVGRYVRRVNRRLRVVRAAFDGEMVVFDYTAMVIGGPLPGRWAAGCLALFAQVVRQARETIDRDKVLAYNAG